MRTDCTIDGKQVRCPNASTTGYGKTHAKVGDFIAYEQPLANGHTAHVFARVLGRVSAPKIDPADSDIDGWLLCMTLSEDGTHAYERWANPEWVTHIRRDPPAKLWTLFTQPKLPNMHEMRRLMEDGYTSDHYVEKIPEALARQR